MLGCAAGDVVQCLRPRGAAAEIAISRVLLAGPPMEHGYNWDTQIVPRLYVYAAAVHKYRRCAALRLGWLCADGPGRADALRRECPHLADVL